MFVNDITIPRVNNLLAIIGRIYIGRPKSKNDITLVIDCLLTLGNFIFSFASRAPAPL